MGIRFRCHHCEYELHVKDFQAGKRGRCPECKGKFRIPDADAATSLALDEEAAVPPNQSENSKTKQQVEPDKHVAQRPAKSKASAQSVAKSQPKTEKPDSEPPRSAAESEQSVAPDLPSQAIASAAQFIPQLLREAPDSTWYVRPPSGGQFGPASADIFLEWMADNRVAQDALVWKDGWPEWLVASHVFEDYFASNLAALPQSQTHPSTTGTTVDSSGTPAPEPSPAQPSLSERNRSTRKQRRKRNYAFMLAVLSVLAIVLILALVFVLTMQG